MSTRSSRPLVGLLLGLLLGTLTLQGCGERRSASSPAVSKKPATDLALKKDDFRLPPPAVNETPAVPAPLPAMTGRGPNQGELASAWSAAGENAPSASAPSPQPRLRSLMEGDDWMSASSPSAEDGGSEMGSALAPPTVQLPDSLTGPGDDDPSAYAPPSPTPTRPSASAWDAAPTANDPSTPDPSAWAASPRDGGTSAWEAAPTADSDDEGDTPDVLDSPSSQMARLGVDPSDAFSGPSTTPAPVLPPVGERKGVQHKVRQWENLWGLARKYGVSSKAIVAFNGLRDPNHIWVGQTLYIPTVEEAASVAPSLPARPVSAPVSAAPSRDAGVEGRDYHLVLRGESLSAIARKYGTSVRRLVELNDVVDASRIFAGMKLKLPGGDGAPQGVPGGGGMPAELSPSAYAPVGGMPDVMTP